jgi:hypothetical protein
LVPFDRLIQQLTRLRPKDVCPRATPSGRALGSMRKLNRGRHDFSRRSRPRGPPARASAGQRTRPGA